MKKFLLLIVSISCQAQVNKSQQVENRAQADDNKTLETSSYSIQYPSTWELDQSGRMSTQFLLFSPLESKDDNFRENVNLVIEDLSGHDISLDQYSELAKGQIRNYISNVNFIEMTKVKREYDEHEKIVYTGDQGAVKLTFEQYYWIHDHKAYVLTFTSEQIKYDAFKGKGESIMNSFAFKK